MIGEIRDFKLEDLDRPEGEKFKTFVAACAQVYGQALRLEDFERTDQFIKQSFFHTTVDQFVEAVQKTQLPNYSKRKAWGHENAETGRVDINLETIKASSLKISNFPGILLYNVLAHEWGHIILKERETGKFLKSPWEVLTSENYPPEQWKKYRGGEIHTEHSTGLEYFDEAWVECMAEQVVMETLQGEPDLSLSAAQIFSENWYSGRVKRLLRLVAAADLGI